MSSHGYIANALLMELAREFRANHVQVDVYLQVVEENALDSPGMTWSQALPAHRFILAAASPFFKYILNEHYHEHHDSSVTITLLGMSVAGLSCLLDIVYGVTSFIPDCLREVVMATSRILNIYIDPYVKQLVVDPCKAQFSSIGNHDLEFCHLETSYKIDKIIRSTNDEAVNALMRSTVIEGENESVIETISSIQIVPLVKEDEEMDEFVTEVKCPSPNSVFFLPNNIPVKMHKKNKPHLKNCPDIDSTDFANPNSVYISNNFNDSICLKEKTSNEDGVWQQKVAQEINHACNLCEKKFVSNRNLQIHMSLVHNKDWKYVCQICNRVFSKNFSLKCHIRSNHTEHRPFKCEVCSKMFSVLALLKAHASVHNEERNHECKICHKRFKMRSTLLHHMPVHKDIRPFVCSICHADFKHTASLTNHMNVHYPVRTKKKKEKSRLLRLKGISVDKRISDGSSTDNFTIQGPLKFAFKAYPSKVPSITNDQLPTSLKSQFLLRKPYIPLSYKRTGLKFHVPISLESKQVIGSYSSQEFCSDEQTIASCNFEAELNATELFVPIDIDSNLNATANSDIDFSSSEQAFAQTDINDIGIDTEHIASFTIVKPADFLNPLP